MERNRLHFNFENITTKPLTSANSKRRIFADVIVYIFSSLAYDLTHRSRGYIQMFRQRLSKKRAKAYAIMLKGSLGNTQ